MSFLEKWFPRCLAALFELVIPLRLADLYFNGYNDGLFLSVKYDEHKLNTPR